MALVPASLLPSISAPSQIFLCNSGVQGELPVGGFQELASGIHRCTGDLPPPMKPISLG